MADSTQGDNQPAALESYPPAENLNQPAAEDQRSEREKIKQAIIDDRVEDLENLLLANSSLLEVRFDHTLDEEDEYLFDTIEGLSPLLFATLLGRLKIVGFLLSNEADALAKTKNCERTIIELAFACGNKDQSVTRNS
ncbi:Mg2+ transporter protein CorA-like/Zinc transport protein ZntB [Penicillium malachiteum]|uniref:Mg2+ transporter protein CorA-like/Zinc transport protein ZntB n=1 Tax=Penicillium malachiteum TaxID=1324776 RepID=A0AAD6MQS6_9EURO|nr:Mg2+ transporter protein CorA-like/Zinc transport protein ZntB [Penicillium malachiteum]